MRTIWHDLPDSEREALLDDILDLVVQAQTAHGRLTWSDLLKALRGHPDAWVRLSSRRRWSIPRMDATSLLDFAADHGFEVVREGRVTRIVL